MLPPCWARSTVASGPGPHKHPPPAVDTGLYCQPTHAASQPKFANLCVGHAHEPHQLKIETGASAREPAWKRSGRFCDVHGPWGEGEKSTHAVGTGAASRTSAPVPGPVDQSVRFGCEHGSGEANAYDFTLPLAPGLASRVRVLSVLVEEILRWC